jgi:NAD(P)-dependent dehydrogenase (short-subunit alcohol dehydrogenase family)
LPAGAAGFPLCRESTGGRSMKENKSIKAVLITGGSSGVGLAAAKRFLASGADVMIAGRSPKRLNQASHQLSSLPGSLKTFAIDVRKVSDCETAVRAVCEAFGRLDVLVNSAGVWVEGNSAESTEDEWNYVSDTNLKGTYFMCSRAIAELKKTAGCIINVSSDAGVVGNKGAAIYCASKGGVNLLTKSLALELAEDLVRVVAVCPADINTPMLTGQAQIYSKHDPKAYSRKLLTYYPQGSRARFIEPEEVAELIFYLASDKAQPITGAAISMDFGTTAGY